nr:formylglycine-generating enzyme family protein [Myxococcota bacterium]
GLVAAEREGDAVAAAHHELLLRQHDRGEHASFLRGVGRVVLDSDPSGAVVVAHRWRTHRRQLVLEEVGSLGTTPIDVELPVGSYVLELRGEDGAIRYPIVIGRDETWDATRPAASSPSPVRLPCGVGPGECYVPAGFTWVGHDALAAEPVPSRRVWIEDFVIQTFPVTCGQYLVFLDDLASRGDEARAWRHAPSVSRAATATSSPAVAREEDRFVMLPDDHGAPIDLECPIASIDWHAAVAYAEWLSAREGRRWRLPSELEWEKAARGVDRRPFPWGSQPEPTWACILGQRASARRRVPVDSYPIDTSPYGARGMAGNVRDWCIEVWKADGPRLCDGVAQVDAAREDDPSPRAIRGGAWTSVVAFARCAGRFAAKPDEHFAVVGLRLVREP